MRVALLFPSGATRLSAGLSLEAPNLVRRSFCWLRRFPRGLARTGRAARLRKGRIQRAGKFVLSSAHGPSEGDPSSLREPLSTIARSQSLRGKAEESHHPRVPRAISEFDEDSALADVSMELITVSHRECPRHNVAVPYSFRKAGTTTPPAQTKCNNGQSMVGRRAQMSRSLRGRKAELCAILLG